jgi:hypothetical protein
MSAAKLKTRDIEKTCSTAQFIAKLRRLADCLEKGERFDIQIAGERIYVPKHAFLISSMNAKTAKKKSNSRLNGKTKIK